MIGESLCEAGRGRTGSMVDDCLSYTKHSKPPVVILETVRNLAATATTSTKTSELEFLVTTLSDEGYICVFRLLRAQDYGVPQSRKSYWIMAFRARRRPTPHQFDNNFSSDDLPLWLVRTTRPAAPCSSCRSTPSR